MPPADDAAARVPLGPVGRYVIENLEDLRVARRLTYRQLADRLEKLGRPIPTLGLSRIEKGNRRVDVDDLVALAIALEVSPGALLLPRDPGGTEDDEVDLTSQLRLSGNAARQWMAGHSPLPGHDAINWPRPAFTWRVRDAELETLRERMSAVEAALMVERAKNGHDQADSGELGRLPRPGRQSVIMAIVTSPRGVLVTRRRDGNPPWGFVAGWGEPGESPADTIVREAKEEADLRVKVGEYLGERDHPATGYHVVYYTARPTHGTEIHLGDKGELTEVRWASLAEADELMGSVPGGIYGPVREYLAREIGGG
jgi:8-oxo-dGTP pyrophosphatase MutT (NUDIX family)/transcriptional regulator with XRE-family HTH domain